MNHAIAQPISDRDRQDRPVREPPHDLEAEAAVIGTCIENADALAAATGMGLEARHLSSNTYRRIYEAAVALQNAGRDVDVVAVKSWLSDNGCLAEIGGAEGIVEAIGGNAYVLHIEQHAERIIGLARVRDLIVEARRIEAEAFRVKGDAQAFLDQAEQRIYQVARQDERGEVVRIGDAVHESHQQIYAAANRAGVVELPTGLTRLDEKLGGLHRQEVTVVAARPGMGKTGLGTDIAISIAARGLPVCVFSLEMPRAQIATRMCCAKAGLSVRRARNGMLHPEQWRLLYEAQDYVKRLPIWIDDTAGISLLQLRAKARRVRAKVGPLGLIMIDYLQLMQGTRERGQSRDEEVSCMTRGIKQLARELDCPVLQLSQLNRKADERQDKRPMLSDLRESGSVEQDADNVVMIYRDDYYHADSKWKGTAELIVAKQRNGALGRVRVTFDGPQCSFRDLTGPNAETEDESD